MNRTLETIPWQTEPILLTDSQDVSLEFPGSMAQEFAKTLKRLGIDPTGFSVESEDGEYVNVWVTDYSQPWNITAVYTRIFHKRVSRETYLSWTCKTPYVSDYKIEQTRQLKYS